MKDYLCDPRSVMFADRESAYQVYQGIEQRIDFMCKIFNYLFRNSDEVQGLFHPVI